MNAIMSGNAIPAIFNPECIQMRAKRIAPDSHRSEVVVLFMMFATGSSFGIVSSPNL